MAAYYNENNPHAAQWLRNLIKAGHIAPGYVDQRSIVDVKAEEIKDYTQCHFFAGIGIWSGALRGAGWPDDKPVWSASCPCQPFSTSGKQKGFEDERHLWPVLYDLIAELSPPVLFGEQVASIDGLDWLDVVQAQMEGSAYIFGAADICAASFGAPHIRQRLYFTAKRLGDTNSSGSGRNSGKETRTETETKGKRNEHRSIGPAKSGSDVRFVEYANSDGRKTGKQGGSIKRHGTPVESAGCSIRLANDQLPKGKRHGSHSGKVLPFKESGRFIPGDEPGRLADDNGERLQGSITRSSEAKEETKQESGRPPVRLNSPSQLGGGLIGRGPTNGFWADADWLRCRDGKWRPTEPRIFPLAHGASGRVGLLRAYGNGIVKPQAEGFIKASVEAFEDIGYPL